MRKENLHQPYEILVEELEVYPKYERVFTFFQLVYIVSGKGKQCINKNHTQYSKGNLFLITPDDCHTFDIEEKTIFVLLRFNDSYLLDKAFDIESKRRVELILHNASHTPGCILYYESDKKLVEAIISSIVEGIIDRELYNKELINQLLNTLIVITARNVIQHLPSEIKDKTRDSKTLEILKYIQDNIFSPDKIRTNTLSQYFGISEKYLGRYFKKHTNETIQQFIASYRLKMVMNRLKFSDVRMCEIVLELGFTDESHLNKFFKKYTGTSPSEYRRRYSL